MHFTILVRGAALPVTPWLPGELKPERPGVYQRSYPAGPYSCWDGRAWCGDAATPVVAASRRAPSPHQSASWRGLAEAVDPACGTCGGEGMVERDDEATGESRIGECPDC